MRRESRARRGPRADAVAGVRRRGPRGRDAVNSKSAATHLRPLARSAAGRTQAARGKPAPATRRRADHVRGPVVADVKDRAPVGTRRARAGRIEDRRMRLDRADPLLPTIARGRQPAAGPRRSGRSSPRAASWRGSRGVPRRREPLEQPAGSGARRQALDERAAVDLDRPTDLVGLRTARRAASSQIARRAVGHAAQPGEDPDERSARSTSRNCGTSSRNWRSRSSRPDARNASRSRSGDARRPSAVPSTTCAGHRRPGTSVLPKSNGDRADRRGAGQRRHVATLDGQISRNGQ